eukprot:gnl/Dysnectes_brevis/8631_a15478_275.p1 GENE.gnl/Dysnectes_brevis/8631_a15478_275~~gnl/Dysnectes_brevis/8631_a15478_275.p1  ORF type:complete len:341 (+),score=54.39 gnl/Dysnectes_brevis/8631_a15478_275:70-1023(+)
MAAACGILIVEDHDIDFTSDYPADSITTSFLVDMRDKIIEHPFKFRLHFSDYSDTEYDFSLNSVKIELYSNRKSIDKNDLDGTNDADDDDTIYTVGLHPDSPWPSSMCAEIHGEEIAGIVQQLNPDITVVVPDVNTAENVEDTSILTGTQVVNIRRSVTIWDHTDGPEENGLVRLVGAQVRRYGAQFLYALQDQVSSYMKILPAHPNGLIFVENSLEKSGVFVDVTITDLDVVSKATSVPVVTLTGVVLGTALLFTAISGILSLVSTVLDIAVKKCIKPCVNKRTASKANSMDMTHNPLPMTSSRQQVRDGGRPTQI